MPAGGGAVFIIAPASCTLLFPYAASLPDVMPLPWHTAIAITNTSAFAETPLSGTVKFTLFPNDEEMIEYSTDGSSPGRVWMRMDLFLRGTPTPCCCTKS